MDEKQKARLMAKVLKRVECARTGKPMTPSEVASSYRSLALRSRYSQVSSRAKA